MEYRIIRTKEEIDDLLNKVAEAENEGHNPYFGMTFGQGISEAINWLTENGWDHPWPEG